MNIKIMVFSDVMLYSLVDGFCNINSVRYYVQSLNLHVKRKFVLISVLFFFWLYYRNPAEGGWINIAFQTVPANSEGCHGDRSAASATLHYAVQWSCKRQSTVDPSSTNKWTRWQSVRGRFQPCPAYHTRGKCLHSIATEVSLRSL